MAKHVRIISVGKAHDVHISGAIDIYMRRLKSVMNIEWILLDTKSHSLRQRSIANESQHILKSLKEAEYVILLDENGTQQTSPAFSHLLDSAFATHKGVAIIIGGAYGVSNDVRKRAHSIVSLGKMVFPHQLVRLIIIEQLYRAATISAGTGYHHD